jgi:hypothetical protein
LEDDSVERFDGNRETLFDRIPRDAIRVVRWPVDRESLGEDIASRFHYLVEDEPVGLERDGHGDVENDDADGDLVARGQRQRDGFFRLDEGESGSVHQYTPGMIR